MIIGLDNGSSPIKAFNEIYLTKMPFTKGQYWHQQVTPLGISVIKDNNAPLEKVLHPIWKQ